MRLRRDMTFIAGTLLAIAAGLVVLGPALAPAKKGKAKVRSPGKLVTASQGYTLEAWVVTRTRTTEEHIISFNHNNGANNIAIFRDEPSNKFKFHDCEGRGCAEAFSKTTPVIGRTYQVVVTVNASNRGHLYVNGRSQATFVSAKRPIHSGRFTIGAEYDLGPKPSSYWHGKIDEVVIYNRAISAKRVAAQWSAGS